MRIAYLCTDFGVPVYGVKGASVHLRELSHALQSGGHTVLLVAARAGGDRPADFDVPVLVLAPEPTTMMLPEPVRDHRAPGTLLARELRVRRYVAALPQRLLPTLQEFEPDVIYERYSLFGTAGVAIARQLGRPLIVEVNAPLCDEQSEHRGLALAETARDLERAVLRAADRVIAVSSELGHWLVAQGVAPGRLSVLPNGVNRKRFEAGARDGEAVRTRLGLGAEGVVGFVGTLKAWHDTATLLRAVAVLHRRALPVRLLVVGDGPARASLEALARQEGIADATTFTGAVPHSDVPDYLASMDVATAPYAASENFYFSPLKLFEYMAAGRPVVAAAVGQLRECIRHGESGWLYPPGDVGALSGAIEIVLKDASLAASLGRGGHAHVREHHTWEGNARAVVALMAPDGRGRARAG
jgi:glycosyltransferase involved in cell wall biosynthesis